MATVTISLVTVQSRAITGATLPIRQSIPTAVASEITSSGTTQQADITAPATEPILSAWEILVSGGDVWVAAGSNPTAVAGEGSKIRDGERVYLGVSAASEKLAVIDA